VGTSQKFLACNNSALVKTSNFKTVYMGMWIHYSEFSLYLEFLV
jgi:hypothetical protein